MPTEYRELRLRYHPESMVEIIQHIDKMKLGELPEFMAMFFVHASNAANWHPVEEA